jgi:hypothetical protein
MPPLPTRRFYTEEAFSFRVRELAPRALRVLDMQDVHFLRAGRQELAALGAPMAEVMAWRPGTDAAECLRELASIHRWACCCLLPAVAFFVASLRFDDCSGAGRRAQRSIIGSKGGRDVPLYYVRCTTSDVRYKSSSCSNV